MTNTKAPTLPMIVRAAVCHLTGNPFYEPDENKVVQYFEDGALAINELGRIEACGAFDEVYRLKPASVILDRRGCLILPGLIDCHIHFPQALIVGSFGEQLLDWLEKYTFPEEANFADSKYAQMAAKIFFEEAIAQGTTTALIFGAHFEEATTIAFEEAQRQRFRALMGMTLADRNIQAKLQMNPNKAYSTCKRLIADFHGKAKLRYAVTPRFALDCSDAMLNVCAQLTKEHPDIYFQTHVNENIEEIRQVKDLFPQSFSYLDVYDRHNLLGPRSIFAHSIHSTDLEIERLAKSQSCVVHCPSSNSFIGSGIMPLRKYIDAKVNIALGTDIGAGTSFSIFQEMNQAYKTQMLQIHGLNRPDLGIALSGPKLLYLATLGGAKALSLDEEIGNFLPGRCADFIIIDPNLDNYFAARLNHTQTISDKLFVIATIGNKGMIREVFIGGCVASTHQNQL